MYKALLLYLSWSTHLGACDGYHALLSDVFVVAMTELLKEASGVKHLIPMIFSPKSDTLRTHRLKSQEPK